MGGAREVDPRPLVLLLIALVLIAGCGGGGHKPRVARPPTPRATIAPPAPVTVVDRDVPCLSYTYGANVTELRAIEAAGIDAVIEYVTYPPETLCARLEATGLLLVRAIYYGDGATVDTIEPVTRSAVLDNAGCPTRLLWTYPWDEPPQREIPRKVVEQSLVSVRDAFPDIPTFIAFGEQRFDKVAPYAGLDLKGIELYARRWLDPKALAERLDRLAGQPLVLIPRAWIDKPLCCNGAFGAWTDAENARLVALAMAEARRRPNVKAVAFYIAQSTDTSKPSQEWLDMPLTRAAIEAACRH